MRTRQAHHIALNVDTGPDAPDGARRASTLTTAFELHSYRKRAEETAVQSAMALQRVYRGKMARAEANRIKLQKLLGEDVAGVLPGAAGVNCVGGSKPRRA